MPAEMESQIARFIINVDRCAMLAAAKLCVSDCVADGVWLAVPQSPKWQSVGNQIDAAFIAALAHFISLDAHKQPDVPQKA